MALDRNFDDKNKDNDKDKDKDKVENNTGTAMMIQQAQCAIGAY